MNALRITSLRSTYPTTFKSVPKVNNFRAFRTNTASFKTSSSLHLSKIHNNLQTVNVKHSNLQQITPKFYVSRPAAQFHTSKFFRQEAPKESEHPKQPENVTEEAKKTQNNNNNDVQAVSLAL